ncbi:MAG: 4-hydroxythreonine-4-phosphate dehydrogenase PdxA [Candidatus Firestonebacteria bacterium]
MKKPIVLITMGDAAGIGPEVIIKALSNKKIHKICFPVVIGDLSVMQFAILKFKSDFKINIVTDIKAEKFIPKCINLFDMSNLNASEIKMGQINKLAGKSSIEYIEKAVELINKNMANAVVTAPINKEAIARAGFWYQGHTEFLAKLTNTKHFEMMLVGGSLKVVLVTRHIPLKEVSKFLSKEKIVQTIKITNKYLKEYFNIKSPKIGVLGLNPHSGEGGLFGLEEKEIIIPAIKYANKININAIGPLVPDACFYKALKGEFDALVCMYHDQGLIPLKMLFFDKGVNITLGLPFIRTSADHGTAYDIAGKGIANCGSMIFAIELAARFSQRC